MKNKILLLGLVVLGIVMSTSLVSAYSCYAGACGSYGGSYAGSYGSWPVNPSLSGRYYPEMPVRVGGFFGANSAFLIGLKPGVFTGPVWTTRTRMNLANQYYPRMQSNNWFTPRIGGYFGNYYGLRPGTFAFSGVGTNYANVPYVYHGPL